MTNPPRTAAWWLLPLACTAWFARTGEGGAPCATTLAACIAATYGAGLWCLSRAIAASLLTAQDPATTLRVWKMCHHAVVAALTLGTLWHYCDTGVFVRGPLPGTSAALTRVLYGVQFWVWSGLAVADARMQSATSSQYAMYAVHHALAIGLIGGSSCANMYTAGAMVLACMDASDVPLSILKVVQSARSPGAAAAVVPPLFVLFCAAWLLFRWVLFPLCLLGPCLTRPWPADRPWAEGMALVGLLLLLQALNVVWTYQIGRMVARGKGALLCSGNAVLQQARCVLQTATTAARID